MDNMVHVLIQVEKANGKTDILFKEEKDRFDYELGRALYAVEIIAEAFKTDEIYYEVLNSILHLPNGSKSYSEIACYINVEYQTKVTIKARIL